MIIVMLTFLGLCLGSFVNALVWRLYQQDLPRKKRAASDRDLSIATGRSMCTHCKHTLGVIDLLPLVSWLLLAGKCRYCHKPIGWQYPVVEAVTALLFVASYILWPLGLTGAGLFGFGVWLAVLVGFMALTVYDLRWMVLPNKIVFPLIALGAVKVLVLAVAFDGGLRTIIDGGLGLLVAGGIFYVLFQVSSGRWIGGGDVKLGFALGLLLGTPAQAFLMLFLASLLGTITAVPGLLTKKLHRSSTLPFGPFLIAATVIVMLFGTALINWYKQQLGIY